MAPPTLGQILLITLISAVISASITYAYRARKTTKKDYKMEDEASKRKPDITIGI